MRGPGQSFLAFDADGEISWRTLANGYRVAGLVLSANRLGLLRALAERPRSSATQLADELVAGEGVIERMCDALACVGLLAPSGDGWILTEPGARLASDRQAAVELDAMAADYELWGRLDERARTIAIGDEVEHPEPVENRGAPASPEAARRAALRLQAYRQGQAVRLVEHFQPQRPVHVVDVGGADGLLSREVCRHWPEATCLLLEEPAMAAVARAACAGIGRIQVREGAFLAPPEAATAEVDPLPANADVILLSHLLQGLPQAAQRDLVVRASKALAPGGCVVSLEFALRYDGGGPLDVLLWGVRQAAAGESYGPVLTAAEQDALLRSAGLAAADECWVSESGRAVLGVRPDAGVEPALRVAGRP